MQQTIAVTNVIGSGLVAEVKWLMDLEARVKASRGMTVVDLSNCTWLNGFSIACCSAIINRLVEEGRFVGYRRPEAHSLSTFLETIGFPFGFSNAKKIPATKTFIPLTKITKNESRSRELISSFDDKMQKSIGLEPGTLNAYIAPIYELFDNFLEHSESSSGFVAGQYYPALRTFEITMLDSGIGFAGSYTQNTGEAQSSRSALENALDGNSSTGDIQRGNGISKSKKIVCNELEGEMLILSGNTAAIPEKSQRTFYNLNDFEWSGSIITLKLPKVSKPINFYEVY